MLRGLLETALTLALATAIGLVAPLNATGVGFLFFIAVLFIASRRSLLVSTIGAVAATLCYNFFFFHPIGTLAIGDPANWLTLGAFLTTSLMANRLLANQRREAERARVSGAEVEALYETSVELLKANGIDEIGAAVAAWLTAIGAASGGLIIFGASAQHQHVAGWMGAPISDEVEDIVAGVGRHRRFTELPSRFGVDVCAPLTIAGRAAGALFVRGSRATRTALESVAALAALAVQHERYVSDRARVEALRQSDELKTSLLQTVAHDLNSPLTVLAVEAEAIVRKTLAHPDSDMHFRTIREQLEQLKRRIDNLLSLARIEAGLIKPRVEPTPAADLFRAARENLAIVAQSRPIRTSIDEDAPDVLVDPSLALEIVVNLVENAHDASPPAAPIELTSRRSTDDPSRVWLEVLDRGNGLSRAQHRALRTVGHSETDRGLGIDLARTLAVLNAGSVEWFAREGGGTIARVDLPAAQAGDAS